MSTQIFDADHVTFIINGIQKAVRLTALKLIEMGVRADQTFQERRVQLAGIGREMVGDKFAHPNLLILRQRFECCEELVEILELYAVRRMLFGHSSLRSKSRPRLLSSTDRISGEWSISAVAFQASKNSSSSAASAFSSASRSSMAKRR